VFTIEEIKRYTSNNGWHLKTVSYISRQVDQNVTRNLVRELDRDDWDVMIVHYLGLDHIGHLSGPYSSLVGPKLREMDALIHRVVDSLKQKKGTNLLIVLGDHGMTVQRLIHLPIQ